MLFFPLLIKSIISLCLLIAASDKKLNIEKAKSQNEIPKLVATPPETNLNVYSPERIKISVRAFLLRKREYKTVMR